MDWLSLGEAAGTFVFGVGTIWFSRRAAKLSEPTGNGFAGVVLAKLTNIEARLTRLENPSGSQTGNDGTGPAEQVAPGGEGSGVREGTHELAPGSVHALRPHRSWDGTQVWNSAG